MPRNLDLPLIGIVAAALVAIALGAGVPAIRWYQNSLRREAPAAEKTAAA